MDYSIVSLCEVMNVSRSGYYKWLKAKEEKKQYQQDREELVKLVSKIYSKYPSFGYRSINGKIREMVGWVVSDNYVHRCCRYLGIKSKVKHYKWKKAGDESIVYPNSVNNLWDATVPFELIVSDTTAIRFKGKLYEWTFYLDTFNNEIVGSAVGEYKSCSNKKVHFKALEDMIEAKIKRGYKDQDTVLHTDQGSIYASSTFANAYKDYNIKQSMSRAGTPTDNPIIESLNGWIKASIKIDIDSSEFKTVNEYIQKVVHYVNYERPSSKLEYKTPTLYRKELRIR
jgi:transposase InsO family protein